MDILWQQIVIGLVLTGAVAYLVRHFWRRAFRKKSPCASCGLMKMVEKKQEAGR